jgi:hypothetical protein
MESETNRAKRLWAPSRSSAPIAHSADAVSDPLARRCPLAVDMEEVASRTGAPVVPRPCAAGAHRADAVGDL